MEISRRAVLGAAAGAVASALGGCLDGEESVAFEEHAASTAIKTQPLLGSLDRSGVIVAFEDPSCRACRRFEAQTFPRLREELVEPGDVAFAYRTLDITFRWAEPAAQVMASTYAVDEDAFWGLKDYIYANHDWFEAGNVHDRVEPYLREAPVDAESVLADARSAAHDDWLERNREAADELGVQATPRFYLFRDGAFRTEVTGPQDYEVFAGALGFE